MIDSFRGRYFFLSNYYPCDFVWEGLLYRNAEAAFQSAKCTDTIGRLNFTNLSPNLAKAKGRKIYLRDDWESIKDDTMLNIIRAKFKNPKLSRKLIATGDQELIEGNTWNDTYWGVCNGIGKNKLGQILMQVREELKNT